MNWELLTSGEFEKAVKKSRGVCLLPVGVIEKHGDHLPLGTDIIYCHTISSLAAQKEPAVVFPYYYFGQIFEARHQPGTVAIKSELLLALLENICDEIGRNGFKKIILVNGHGGNSKMLPFFCQLMLEKPKGYTVYFSEIFKASGQTASQFEAKVDEHGGEKETSCIMGLRPELVKKGKDHSFGLPMKRLSDLEKAGLYSGIFWYSNHPGHFCSDGTPGTVAKGEAFVNANVAHLAAQVKVLKKNTTARRLYDEFYGRAQKPVCRSR